MQLVGSNGKPSESFHPLRYSRYLGGTVMSWSQKLVKIHMLHVMVTALIKRHWFTPYSHRPSGWLSQLFLFLPSWRVHNPFVRFTTCACKYSVLSLSYLCFPVSHKWVVFVRNISFHKTQEGWKICTPHIAINASHKILYYLTSTGTMNLKYFNCFEYRYVPVRV